MFGFLQLFRSTESPTPLPALSIIGDDTTIRGDTVTGSGDLRIEGTVHADVVRKGRVVVAPEGAVHGSVHAQSIHVAGTARGELHAEDSLVLDGSSDVKARLQADSLTIESGADFKGLVHGENEDACDSLSTSGDQLPGPVEAVDVPPPEASDDFVPVWDAD